MPPKRKRTIIGRHTQHQTFDPCTGSGGPPSKILRPEHQVKGERGPVWKRARGRCPDCGREVSVDNGGENLVRHARRASSTWW